MKTIKTILLLVGLTYTFQLSENQIQDDQQLKDLFQQYQIFNNKNYYTPEEYDYRFQVFVENAKFLLHDFKDINHKIKIREKDGQKIMVVQNKNPCQEELALNDFMDYSKQEFSNNYLLQPDYFDTNNYKANNEIYLQGLDNFSGFSYHNNPNWITNEIDSVLQNPNFDIFDETLKYRQNSLKMQQPNYDFQNYQMHNNLLGFTKHDDDYYQQQIKLFLFSIMPNYDKNFHLNQIQEDQQDQKLQNECQQFMYEQQKQGRRLQYYDFDMDSFWDKYYDQLTNKIVNDQIQKQNMSSQNQVQIQNPSNMQIQNNQNNITKNVQQQNKIIQNNKIQQENTQTYVQQQSIEEKQKTDQEFIIDEKTKVYKTNTIPPQYIAVSYGKVKKFSENPKQKLNEEKRRKERLIAQIKQMLQLKQQNKKVLQQNTTNIKPQNIIQQPPVEEKTQKNQDTVTIEGVEIPKYVNWQEKAKFTPVKNQQKCNACYAFGAIATLETHISLKFNEQIQLSEQEILDCSPGNQACNGGQPYLVYDYIKDQGVNLQQDYPYIARKQFCRRQLDKYRYKQLSGRIFVKPGMLNLLKAVNFGPVAVVSHASDFLKYFYDGTFTGRGCYNKKTPNHASMLYGYNLNAPQPYLLFKNNWGLSWGNRGYYKVTIGQLSNQNLGHCLIAETTFNVIPII